MWYQLTSFLNYHLNKSNSNSSSYTFESNGIEVSLDKFVDNDLKKQFRKYKLNLLKSNEKINVTDFGSGSRIFKSDQRPVSKIAKIAGISDKNAFRLLSLCKQFQPKNILEIGTSLGIATYTMHLGAPNTSIISVEGCKNTAAIAKRQLQNHKAKNIHIEVGSFETVLPELFSSKEFDFIYFDGNHSKKATTTYFNWAVENVQRPAIFIFDDIHWSKEMNEAWQLIKKHKKVTAFRSTFQWGILFFDKT